MKRNLFALFVAGLLSVGAFAQQKIGHVNLDSLLIQMPDYKTAMAQLQTEQDKYQKEITEMQTELQTRAQAMEANAANWSQLRIQNEQKALQDAYQNIQAYMQTAQEDLQTKEVELLNPVLKKLQDTLNAYGEENGYSYILDSSRSKGVVIFVKKGDNLMKGLKTKLGI